MFLPEVLRPDPDPAFVRELRRIDPELRVVFGYDRYLVKRWAVERRLSPERYFSIYAGLLESNEPRFVDQPVYDTDQPIFDEHGDQVTFKVVGYRKFDLAPEYEWVMFADALDQRVLTDIRRSYAWERNHPLSRMKFEKEQEEARKEAARARKNADIGFEGVKEGWRRAGKTVQGGQPEKVMEGTEIL